MRKQNFQPTNTKGKLMKLSELSGATENQTNQNPALRAVVVNEMRLAAPFLEFAEFYQITGNSDTPRKAATAQGGSTRALDSNYTPVVATPTFGSVALKIYGDMIQTDQAHQRRGSDIGSERVRQLVSFSRALGRHLQNDFVNGDSATPNQFDGLKKLIGVGQQMLINGDVNGFQVVLGNDNSAKRSQQIFLNALDELVANAAPSILLMGPKTIAYLKSIGREYVRTTTVRSALTQEFDAYNNVPIINAGYGKNGTTLVIDNAETQGTSTDCTSVYAIRFGEQEDTTFATNVGVEVSDLGKVGQQYQTSVDFDIALAILNEKSAWRLKGIRLA